MKNSVYKFDKRIVNNIEVTDYTSVYYGKLLELFKQFPDFFMTYTADIDDKLENISYNLYGSENYADIILAANSNTFLWNMTYNNDVVLEHVSSLQRIIIKELNIDENSSQAIIDVFNKIEDDINDLNSRRRELTVVKPEKLNSLLSMIDTYREDNTVTDITDYSLEE